MLLLGFGERARSAGAVRIVRRRAVELNIDFSHFRGKRRWSDDDLRRAVAECHSWEEVINRLGLSTASGSVQPHVKSHTVRLGLDTDHLKAVSHVGRQPPEAVPVISTLRMEPKHLRVAAPVTAAAWFMLRGCAVSFPAEPTVYDLLADTPQGITRVQAKTTTSATKNYGWMAGVGHHPDTHSKKKSYVLAYSPDEIDLFFIVDGDMTLYLIPSRAIAGRVGISLRTYRKYIVGNAQGLLGVAPDASESGMRASA
jgi:PD-(D/E)XK nuclease superfamily protein